MGIMKLNIACPATGCQKVIEVEDEKKLRMFWDKRISQEVDGEVLGPEFNGYIFKITGGNDKQGFPMMQGVLLSTRTRLLLKKGSKCYRPRKAGERKRKSVRGCIVSHDLSVLNLSIVKKGDADVEGLTDEKSAKPRRLGPKRANKIKKMFNLGKNDDVREFVKSYGREKEDKNGKKHQKRVKIQRLVTPVVLQRKRAKQAFKVDCRKRAVAAKAAYAELLHKRHAEARAARAALVAKKRRISRTS